MTGLMVLPLCISWFLYFTVVESINGATFGHQGLNLKVVTTSRRKIGFTQAFLRHLLDPIDIFMWGLPAFIAINAPDRKQRLGDMLANTIVVDTKDPEQYPVAIASNNAA